MLVVAGDDSLDAGPADPDANGENEGGEDEGGDAFDSFVAVLVVAVGFFVGEFDADDYDDGADEVGDGVDGVGDHGGGVGEDAGEEFEGGEEDVGGDAVFGGAHGELFV